MTQEPIANMPGVRRPGVTEAAPKLQDAGFIRCNSGHLEVLDRPGLDTRACECYSVANRDFERLLPDLKRRWKHAATHASIPHPPVVHACTIDADTWYIAVGPIPHKIRPRPPI